LLFFFLGLVPRVFRRWRPKGIGNSGINSFSWRAVLLDLSLMFRWCPPFGPKASPRHSVRLRHSSLHISLFLWALSREFTLCQCFLLISPSLSHPSTFPTSIPSIRILCATSLRPDPWPFQRQSAKRGQKPRLEHAKRTLPPTLFFLLLHPVLFRGDEPGLPTLVSMNLLYPGPVAVRIAHPFLKTTFY